MGDPQVTIGFNNYYGLMLDDLEVPLFLDTSIGGLFSTVGNFAKSWLLAQLAPSTASDALTKVGDLIRRWVVVTRGIHWGIMSMDWFKKKTYINRPWVKIVQ